MRQIHFPATFELDGAVTTVNGQTFTAGLGSYVSATPEQIDKVVREFMHPGPAKKIKAPKRHRARQVARTLLRDALSTGRDLVAAAPPRKRARMPVFVPAQITLRAQYPTSTDAPNPRRYVIKDEDGRRHAAYRLTLAEDVTKGQYYGIQGTLARPAAAGGQPPDAQDRRPHVLAVHGRRGASGSSPGRARRACTGSPTRSAST